MQAISQPHQPKIAFRPGLWVILADKASIRVFAAEGASLKPVHHLDKPDLKIDGLDNRGRGRSASYGGNRHAYDATLDESRQEETAMVRQLAGWLDDELDRGAFSSLVLIAGPQMLGELRRTLGDKILHKIVAEANKNLASLDERALAASVHDILLQPEYAKEP